MEVDDHELLYVNRWEWTKKLVQSASITYNKRWINSACNSTNPYHGLPAAVMPLGKLAMPLRKPAMKNAWDGKGCYSEGVACCCGDDMIVEARLPSALTNPIFFQFSMQLAT